MSSPALQILHELRRSALRAAEARATDGELLDRFIATRDEAAFEALLRRHGGMALGVCRRILRNDADADDAFQATFLVLVRKARSIRPRSMVGAWLYGVARTTSLKARAMRGLRRAREQAAPPRLGPAIADQTWARLEALLDQELNALPDIYRSAIVLCDLEGKSIQEAARQLGCPGGTIGVRLARGRRLLSGRLERHGLAIAGGALTALTGAHAQAS